MPESASSLRTTKNEQPKLSGNQSLTRNDDAAENPSASLINDFNAMLTQA